MAISIDVTPKIDTQHFTDSIKLGIARGLLETARDLVANAGDPLLPIRIDHAITTVDNCLRSPATTSESEPRNGV